MIKCILETKVERVGLTLGGSRFILTKNNPLTLLLSKDDIRIVELNKFINLKQINAPKKISVKKVEPIKVEPIIEKLKEETLKEEQKEKIKDMLAPKVDTKSKQKGKNNNKKKNK